MRIRVLVAADLRLVRDWLARDLGAGPDVEVSGSAADPDAALALARRTRPDLLVFDRGMPDSLVMVRDIRAELPRIRILAFGAQETEAEIAVCADAGVHGFIARDAGAARLLESVRRVVRGDFVGSAAVTAMLLAHFAQRTEPLSGHRLSSREVEILRLIEVGRSNKEIAAAVGIEVATVKNHVHRLLRKLQVRRRTEAAAKWRRSGAGTGTRWVARRAG